MLGVLNKRPLDILSRGEVEDIHEKTLELLENVGCAFHHKEVLNILEEHGAYVDYEKQIARLPSYLVEEALRKAPHTYRIYDKTQKEYCKFGEGRFVSRLTEGRAYVVDPFKKIQKKATLSDLKRGIMLGEALSNTIMNNANVTPQDVEPPSIRDVYMWKYLFEYASKPVGGAWTFEKDSAIYILKMAEKVAGGKKELRSKPIIRWFMCECTSPLTYSKTALDVLLIYARAGLPIIFAPMVMAGGTGPITLVGDIMQQNAENLAGIVATELINPGTPVTYMSASSILDMKTTLFCYGSPEQALVTLASIQLARNYRLPNAVMANHTDALVPGPQAAFEKAIFNLSSILSGTDEFGGIGFLGEDGFSFEQAIIDDEIAGALLRIAAGFEISEETLAFDIIEKVGPGGNFLTQKHTRDHFKSEQWFPSLINRLRWEEWQAKGSKNIVEKAHERIDELIKKYEPNPLPKDIQKELDEIVKEAEKKLK